MAQESTCRHVVQQTAASTVNPQEWILDGEYCVCSSLQTQNIFLSKNNIIKVSQQFPAQFTITIQFTVCKDWMVIVNLP